MVDRPGFEPGISECKPDVFPLLPSAPGAVYENRTRGPRGTIEEVTTTSTRLISAAAAASSSASASFCLDMVALLSIWWVSVGFREVFRLDRALAWKAHARYW